MKTSSTQSEFDLIRRYFAEMTTSCEGVSLGIGDDAAVLSVPPGMELVVSMDTLVAGIHFFPTVDPSTLGHKALAVNLSDLAAMGAEPAWVTLAITLPEVDESWLEAFSKGFGDLARQYQIALVGGDTTRGPLSITVQAHGFVPSGWALRRDGARVGDEIYVTGTLGDAALYLASIIAADGQQSCVESLSRRLEMPQPRVEAGLTLRRLAGGSIDISDGLLADLGHMLEASDVGGSIALSRLPLSDEVNDWIHLSDDWSPVIAGGDDYELCFTAAPSEKAEIDRLSDKLDLQITCIGTIEEVPGLRVVKPDGDIWSGKDAGFDHFKGAG
ncbi:MAG: thiamine-phosphate kinase [Candidatus Thiodiazotropha sp. (ex Notomyrtea botanica)]|nr:thiamine-phosphate kinase [Candidatus Thiodiazotropha sp. (ex Notomyrtea botanica)]